MTIEMDPPVEVGEPIHHGLGDAMDPHLHDALMADPMGSLGALRLEPKMGAIRTALTSWYSLRYTPAGFLPALILGLLSIAQSLDGDAFNLANPTFVREGISIGQLIGVLVYVGIFTTLLSVVIGLYCERHKRVPVLAFGTIIAGIAGAFTGYTHTQGKLGIARAFDDGIGTAGDTPRFSLLTDYYPPEARARAFSFTGAMANAGQILSLLIFAVFFTEVGIRHFFLALGILLVLVGTLALITLREPVRGQLDRVALGASVDAAAVEDEPESFGEAFRSTFAVQTIKRFFAADIVGSVVDASGVFTVFLLADIYNLTPGETALFFLPRFIVGLAFSSYGGAVVDRLLAKDAQKAVNLFAIFGAVGVVPTLAQAIQPPLIVLLVIFTLTGISSALSGPAVRSIYSLVLPPTSRTVKLQITGLATLPMSLIFLPIMQNIENKYGYSAVFYVATPFVLIAAGIQSSAGRFFSSDRRNAVAATMATEEHRLSVEEGAAKQLVCRSVDVSYGDVQVLFDVDFDVNQGEIIALLGTNGAGKSTLLRAIAGSQPANNGAIVFNGRDITSMPAHESAARGVVLMPGGKGTFPGLSVRDNLLLGCYLDNEHKSVGERINEVLEIFPALSSRMDDEAGLLSGGEQQQLSLALAFLLEPTLLMIDELSLGLSPVIVGQLLDIVREINRRGVTIIVVEQSVNVALQLAEKAVFMEKGEIRFVGSTADLMNRPDILRAIYVKGTGGGSVATVANRTSALDAGFNTTPALEVIGLKKSFGGNHVLKDLSFTLARNESVGIIGPNGSGKTTMFDIVSGFLPADAGTVMLGGVDISKLGPEARAAKGLVRRFQDAKLFPSLTVYETLLVSLEQKLEVRNIFVTALGLPQARRAEARIRRRAQQLLDLLELGDYRDTFIRELSTGLRRVVDIACVLALEPDVLMLDEPSSGISQAEAEGLAPLLRRVRKETGCSLVIIEHDMPLISAVSDELIALAQGSVLIRDVPSVVLDDPRVVASYLGDSDAAVNRSGSLT